MPEANISSTAFGSDLPSLSTEPSFKLYYYGWELTHTHLTIDSLDLLVTVGVFGI